MASTLVSSYMCCRSSVGGDLPSQPPSSMSSCCTLLFPGISIPSPPPVSRIPPSGHACPVGSPCSCVCIMWLDERVGCSHTPPPLHTHIIHVYQLVSTCTCMSCSGDSPGNVQHPGGELILTDYLHTSPTKNYFFSSHTRAAHHGAA